MFKKLVFVGGVFCLLQSPMNVYASDVEWEATTEKQAQLKSSLKNFRGKLVGEKELEKVEALVGQRGFTPDETFIDEETAVFKKDGIMSQKYVYFKSSKQLYLYTLQTGFAKWIKEVEKTYPKNNA